MGISVFLSYPRPYLKRQEEFINQVIKYLEDRSFTPRTLGITDYDMNAPLTAIRRLMLESNGLITIAFRRAFVEKGTGKPSSDIGQSKYDLSNKWTTSPYCHIEPAMAFQIGLPILVLRESGVIDDGVLERGVTGLYLPEFDLDKTPNIYLESSEWRQIMGQWEGNVRKVLENKGCPPKLY
ncbi:hypothetical protein D3C74_135410 [compost metagenome]